VVEVVEVSFFQGLKNLFSPPVVEEPVAEAEPVAEVRSQLV
jgi:hypothetical protein